MKRRLLAMLLAMSMLFTLLPGNVAMAVEDSGTGPVAKIVRDGKDVNFDTFDAAFKDAKDGENIILLKDCDTEAGINLGSKKHITISGADQANKPTLNFTQYGMALWQDSELTFNDIDITMNGVGSTPYVGEWNWQTICASTGITLNLNNVVMSLDGSGTQDRTHAIYFCGTDAFNMKNSTLNIKNYPQDAIEWDGERPGYNGTDPQKYNINMDASQMNLEKNRSGFAGTFTVVTNQSALNVNNNLGNGSNGSHYYFTDSVVNFNDNGSHGLSAGKLSIKNSKVTANHNGLCGIHVTKGMDMDGTSTLTIQENCYKTWAGSSALRIYSGNGKYSAEIKSGAVVDISNNKASGIETYANTTFEEGVKLNITNNILDRIQGDVKGHGGGIFSDGEKRVITLTLPSDAVIYNNHAISAGDDIYSTKKINFGPVGNNWTLDDCDHAIDNWYYDGENARWSAHNSPVNVDPFTEAYNENNLATVNGPLALKAAHGLIPQVVDNNKSKEATNLDGSYESKITLGLPHDTEAPAPDPVGPRVETKAAPSEGEVADISWGSSVEDYMGYVEDDYNFDFINDAEHLSVSVNGTSYPAVKIEDNVYGFKPLPEEENPGPLSSENPEDETSDSPTIYYEYYLEYFPAENGEEHFVWYIDTTVGAFDDVQLHYAVKLTNPKSEPGEYGQYDKDGSKGYEGLYTNNSAILYPVNAREQEAVPEIYNKPTVSYNVAAPTPTPTPNPNPIPIDPAGPEDLNTVDHYSYIVGYPDGTVRPEGKITRGEVATIFFRLLTDDARNAGWSQTNKFTDVPADTWYSNAISTLTNMGVLSGYKDGTFRPNAPITRAEYATIAVSFYKETVKDYQGTFSDVPQGQWYTQYVETAAAFGLISGYPDGTFAPNKNISRAEACTITNQTLNRQPCKDHLLPVEEMINWPDNQPDAWYYYDMQEATNSHDYEWDGDKEKWTTKLSQRDWVQLEKEWSEANSATGGGEVKDENK